MAKLCQYAGSDEYIFYEKCLKPTGLGYAAGVLLEQSEYQWTVLGIHRESTSEPYQQRELDILQRLSTHLRRSLQIYRQLSETHEENQDMCKLFNSLKTGVVILNQHASLIYANYQAQSMIAESSVLILDRYNQLKTISQFQTQLNQYITGALIQLDTNLSDVGGVMTLNDESDQDSILISVVPFSNLQNHVGLNSGYSENLQTQSPQVAIFLTTPNHQVYLAKQYLMTHYQLSNRETEICEYFAQGLDLTQIATQCGITISSVRTYLKHIFIKVGCKSQADLMRKLLNYSSSFQHIY